MGSSVNEEKDTRVELTFLTDTFEELCPFFMAIGMSYDEYWNQNPYIARYYLKAYNKKIKMKDEDMHRQGMYYYEALCCVSPVLHAFSKKGTKPLPYSKYPYSYDEKENLTPEQKEKLKELELFKLKIWMMNMKQRSNKVQYNQSRQKI